MGFKLSSIAAAQKPESKGGFEILQPGLYLAHISEAKAGTCKSGTEKVDVTLEVKDFEGNSKGKVWESVFFTEKNAYAVGRFLKAIGVDVNDTSDDTDYTPELVAQLAEKADVLIQTKIEKGTNGYKDRARVDSFGVMGGYASLDETNKWYTIIVEGKDPDAEDEFDAMNDFGEDAPEDIEF